MPIISIEVCRRPAKCLRRNISSLKELFHLCNNPIRQIYYYPLVLQIEAEAQQSQPTSSYQNDSKEDLDVNLACLNPEFVWAPGSAKLRSVRTQTRKLDCPGDTGSVTLASQLTSLGLSVLLFKWFVMRSQLVKCMKSLALFLVCGDHLIKISYRYFPRLNRWKAN